MIATKLLLLTAALLSVTAKEVGPDVTLPPELEVCILKAEVCILELQAPLCGQRLPDLDAAKVCSANFEDCSYEIPEAHQPACRLDYVWCKIESTADMEAEQSDWLKWCGEVFATCPST